MAVDLVFNPVNVRALVLVCATRTLDSHVLDVDITAHARARADQVAYQRIILLARSSMEVLDRDIGNGKIAWELQGRISSVANGIKGAWKTYLVAKREVLLTIALRDFNCIVDVGENHAIVGDVGNGSRTAASLQIVGQSGANTWPDLDAGSVGSI